MSLLRVAYDDLHYTDGHVYVYNGEPFTGVGVEEFEDGSIRCEIAFLDGETQGTSREFYESGCIKDFTCLGESGQGLRYEWYESGDLKSRQVMEYGVLTESQSYAEGGQPTESYVRDITDHMMQKLVLARRKKEAENFEFSKRS